MLPGLVNLVLGVPAIVPLGLLRWLVTTYLPMDCGSVGDVADPGLTNCDYTTLDHAGAVMFLLVASGLLMLGLVFVVDVVLPVRRGGRPGRWLATAVLIPVPFAVCLGLV